MPQNGHSQNDSDSIENQQPRSALDATHATLHTRFSSDNQADTLRSWTEEWARLRGLPFFRSDSNQNGTDSAESPAIGGPSGGQPPVVSMARISRNDKNQQH